MSPDQRFACRAAWARAYAELGVALVPIPPGQKAPITHDWPNQAITDPILADAYWDEHPDDNMGALLGWSGLLSFDVDAPAHARRALNSAGFDIETILACGVAIEGHPAKAKRLFRAPLGKALRTHKWSWPADPSSESDKRMMVLELRAGALQDVLPPSGHPDTGRPYRYLAGRDPWAMGGFPEAPPELLRLWAAWPSIVPALLAACPWRAPDERKLRDAARGATFTSGEWGAVREEIRQRLSVREALRRMGRTP